VLTKITITNSRTVQVISIHDRCDETIEIMSPLPLLLLLLLLTLLLPLLHLLLLTLLLHGLSYSISNYSYSFSNVKNSCMLTGMNSLMVYMQ
jgi:hypothetical protein